MRSITAERLEPGSGPDAAFDGADEGTLRSGLRVLSDMARRVRAPRDAGEEIAALQALAMLRSRREFDVSCDDMRERLSRDVVLAGTSDARALMEWMGDGRDWACRLLPWRRRRRARHQLLFVVLVRCTAPTGRSEALPVLGSLGFWGREEVLDRWLETACSGAHTRRSRQLALSYLDIVRAVVYEDGNLLRPEFQLREEEFLRWPWPRQLVHLVAWRNDATGPRGDRWGEPVAPIFRADRLEFRLSRGRSYRRLARRGGSVAKAVLRQLGYRDWDAPAPAFPWGAWACAAACILLALGAAYFAFRKSDAFDAGAHRLARDVFARFGADATEGAER